MLRELPPIYRLTHAASRYRIELAKQRLTTSCMKRHGFAYDPAPPARPDSATDDWSGPFGLETLARRGDGEPDPVETPRGEAFGRALYGDATKVISARGATLTVSRPASGCMAEAERHLLGDGRVRWIELTILLFEAATQATRQLDRDPEFGQATARWSRCMRTAGFDYDTPIQVLDRQPPDADPGTVPASRADVRCKDETGYLITGYTRLAGLQQDLLDADPSLAGDWTILLQRQDKIARTVLHG
jgi:hypothetical protein